MMQITDEKFQQLLKLIQTFPLSEYRNGLTIGLSDGWVGMPMNLSNRDDVKTKRYNQGYCKGYKLAQSKGLWEEIKAELISIKNSQ